MALCIPSDVWYDFNVQAFVQAGVSAEHARQAAAAAFGKRVASGGRARCLCHDAVAQYRGPVASRWH